MNKFKILKILYVTTTTLLITNISAFAQGEKVEKQKIKIAVRNKKQFKEDENKKVSQNKPVKNNSRIENESEAETAPETDDDSKFKDKKIKNDANTKQEKINNLEIEGLKFKEICIDIESNEPIYFNEKYNIFLAKGNNVENNLIGHLDFTTPLFEGEKGEPHGVEHLLVSNSIAAKKTKDKKWFSIGIYPNSEFSRNNAYTYNLFDATALIQFDFNKELFKEGSEKEFQDFVNMFLGKAEFLTDNYEIFKREIKNKYAGKIVSRILHELLNRENPTDFGGLFNKANLMTQDERYEAAGLYKEMKKLTFKEIKDFYFKYIVKNNPCLFLKVKDLKEAKRAIYLFKKYYYDKKEAFNIPEIGKNKKFDYFKKVKLPKEMNKFFFKYSKMKNNKKVEKIAKYVLEAEYKLEDFDDLKNWCFSFLDIERFLKKAVDIKKYGFKNITSTVNENDRLVLKIYGDDEKLFERKNLEKNLKEIEKEIINYLNKNKITLEDIDKKYGREKRLEKQIRKREYSNYMIYRSIIKSLAKYKTPFAKRYFTLDENGRILDRYEDYLKYFEKNCSNIIKNSLEKNPIKIRVYEKSKENFNEKKVQDLKQIKLPYKINSKNITKSIIAEEIIVEFLTKNLSDKGLIYAAIIGSYVLNNHMHTPLESEIEIFRNFFKKDFGRLLKNLKLEDSYIKDKIELYKKVAKTEQNNLEELEKETIESINSLKEILNEKKLNIDKAQKIINKITEKIKTDVLFETVVIVKLEKKDYETLEKIIKNLNNIINQFPKIYVAIKDSKKLDKKIIKQYKELLNKGANLEQELLKYINLLKLKNQKQINDSKAIKTSEIKEILKNITVENFSY